MKALKIVGIILVALVVLIILLGIIAPKKYSVERSVIINSPRHLVFAYASYWRNWQTWTPWTELDPAVKVTIEGVDDSTCRINDWR
jgi:hypothetical protein